MSESHISLNIIGKISHFFATNRPLSLLLSIVIILFGLLAFFVTPKQYNPEIVRPAFALTMTYQGATPQEAIDRVVYELVEKVVTIPGVDDVYTTVADGAVIQTTVIFEVGYDAMQAKVDLLSQIQQHTYLARGFIGVPSIIEINPETIPVLQVVFGSDTLSINEIRKKVLELSHRIGNIKDVSVVDVVGGYQPTLVVQIDPVAMASYGVTIPEVSQTLQNGQIRLVGEGFTSQKQSVEMVFDGRTQSPVDVGMLNVKDEIQIRDIARVYQGASSDRGYVIYDTADSGPAQVVMLSVSKVEGSSAPVVTGAVTQEIAHLLQTDMFSDLSYTVVSDDGVTAQKEILGLTKNLITSIVIVVLVLLLFLSFRAATVVFVAIPLTLLVVFGVGFLFDQTINRITLFALILSLGLLVDSAIVVTENMYEHLGRMSKRTIVATREIVIAGAVHEIGVGLLLSTVTSVIVFLPMRYITGMMGPYMGPVAFFVPVALIVSLLVAIVVTPFVATYILQVTDNQNPLTAFIDRTMQRLIETYQRILKRILYNRTTQKVVLLGALVLFLVSLMLPFMGLVHFQMLPRADRDQFYVYIDASVDTPAETTRDIAHDISGMITSDADTVNVQQFIAQAPIVDFNGMFKGSQNRMQPYQATLRVNLTTADTRKRSSTDIVTSLRTRVGELYPEYVSFVRFIEEPPGPPVRATLVARVTGETLELQQQFAQDVYTLFNGIKGVVDLDTSQDDPVGRVVYTFNHQKAQEYGVSINSVVQTLQLFTGSLQITEYLSSTAGEFTPVVLALPYTSQNAPADIASIQVPTQNGDFVPIVSVVDTSYTRRPSPVSFVGVTPVTYVTGEIQERSIVYVVIEGITKLVKGDLPGYQVEEWSLLSMKLRNDDGQLFTLQWGGEWEMTLENFRDLGVAMGVALLLVYAVLVAQYNSFSKPAYILVTVPLGLIGILWGFFLLENFIGVTLTATALIGFIALIGLVVNNAIIYLEYVEQLQETGLSLEDSLIEAGGVRLRPIFLTSLTTILGSLTIVNDPVWSGLAWAIIFGLSLSTVLTLVMYPTLLVYFHRKCE